jgi:RNase P protein component
MAGGTESGESTGSAADSPSTNRHWPLSFPEKHYGFGARWCLNECDWLSVVASIASHNIYLHGSLFAVFRGDGYRLRLATSVTNNGRREPVRDLTRRAFRITIRRLVIWIRIVRGIVIRANWPCQRRTKTKSMSVHQQRLSQGWRPETERPTHDWRPETWSDRERSPSETTRSTECLIGNECKNYPDNDHKAGGRHSNEHRTHHLVRCPAASKFRLAQVHALIQSNTQPKVDLCYS